MAYDVFSKAEKIEHGFLAGTSAATLFISQQHNEDQYSISVVQPDLNFEQLKPIKGYSQPVSLSITLKGYWQVAEHNQVTSVQQREDQTIITLNCQHGLPIELAIKQGEYAINH